MENTNYLLVYLAILLGLLGVVAFFILRQALKTRRMESALSRLQKKLSTEKGTAAEYYELGGLLLDKKLFTQAALYLQQALKNIDDEADGTNAALIYNALGYAYFAQEQYDLAIKQYKEALKVEPDYVTALNNMGHSYERKQLVAQALDAYDQVVKLDATNTTAKRRAEALRKRA
jgi:tetratricopeptide (TPR) repeat protein